jgi:hypothetical protein
VPRLTRRRALELAGAATAVAVLRPGDASAASFSQVVGGSGPRKVPRFDLIGVDGHGQVRARLGRGRWTPWVDVHGPEQPVWTGAADTYQVRGVRPGAKARFTRTGPAPRPAANAFVSRQTGRPHIIRRSEWGGDKLPPKSSPTYGTVALGFVHHTVTANVYDPEDSAGIVLGIARYHRDHNGWNDIGYQFLVDRYGQVFEGRDGGMTLAVVGAQAQGYNSTSFGVSCMGDFTAESLPGAAVESLSRLIAWKLSLHGVPCTGKVRVTSAGGETNRYGAGTRVTFNRISGHRDGNATGCPGDLLYQQLPSIRARAAQLADDITALTVGASRTELAYPDTAMEVTGVLRFADETDPYNAPIVLQYQTAPGQPWQTIQSLAADTEGAFATTLTPTASGRFRAVHPADGIHEELHSAPIAFKVAPALTVAADPNRVVTGDPVTISVTAEPITTAKGRIVVQRRVGSRYRLVTRQRLTLVDGSAATTFTPTRAGRYRITFQAGGSTVRRSLRAL